MANGIQNIQNKIYEIRGQRVMLDRDLAELYGVETKALNQAVKRNSKRFEGDDFMFRLTKDETTSILLRSQIVTLEIPENKGLLEDSSRLRSHCDHKHQTWWLTISPLCIYRIRRCHAQ